MRRGAGVGASKQRRLRLAEQLRSLKVEIVQVVRLRAETVVPVPEFADPEYTRGLKHAAAAAVEYMLSAMESDRVESLSIPPDLLVQARMAARHNVALGAVLQRYIAGFSAVSDFILKAAERHGAAPGVVVGEASYLVRLLLDEISVAVSAEHAAEEQRLSRSSDHLDTERVVRLLNGELRFANHFSYDFLGRHLGIVAVGEGASSATEELARVVGAALLAVSPGERSVWGWLQTSDDVDWSSLEAVAATLPEPVAIAAGELRQGLQGWRRTHLEARAALALATETPGCFVRFGRNELLIAAMNDEILEGSLRDSYLVPLSEGGRGAAALKQTVRAYLDTGRNASSAAATLGVSRQTVNARVRTAEELIGQPLISCASAIEVALRLDAATDGSPDARP